MVVKRTEQFDDELDEILRFIAKHSKENAKKFAKALLAEINKLKSAPYRCQKFFELDDENTRQLVFKGYTIPYFIDSTNNQVVILGIFNQNLWEKKE